MEAVSAVSLVRPDGGGGEVTEAATMHRNYISTSVRTHLPMFRTLRAPHATKSSSDDRAAWQICEASFQGVQASGGADDAENHPAHNDRDDRLPGLRKTESVPQRTLTRQARTILFAHHSTPSSPTHSIQAASSAAWRRRQRGG
jgi:hypothetical protein